MKNAALTLVVALLCLPSLAHKVGLSKVEVDVQGARVNVSVGLAVAEAEALSGSLVELEGCELERTGSEPVNDGDGEGIAILFEGTCPAETQPTLTLNYLQSLALGHRSIVLITADDGWRSEAVLTRRAPSVSFDRAVHGETAGAFLGLGVEHILIGADHLLFLFGLVLVGARKRDILKMVSAFTLAHSITLTFSVLGWISLSPTIVEAVIALSVAFVGLENLFQPDASKRWRLTFIFGLVHGFGFAGVLKEIGLPSEQTGLALVLFNVGVELGQLLALALVLPLLWMLRRNRKFARYGTAALSIGVLMMGLLWFLDRVV